MYGDLTRVPVNVVSEPNCIDNMKTNHARIISGILFALGFYGF